jgi:hypothetical protein
VIVRASRIRARMVGLRDNWWAREQLRLQQCVRRACEYRMTWVEFHQATSVPTRLRSQYRLEF